MANTLTTRRRAPRNLLSCGLIAGAALCAAPALAEGNKSTLTTTMGVTGGRNLDLQAGGDETLVRLNGALNYAFEMQSRRTQLLFQAGIRPETDKDGSGLYPLLDFRLRHDASSTIKLRFDAGIDRTRVTDQSISYDDTGSIVEYDGSGERSLTRLSAGIEGGVDMPFGYTLGVNHRAVDYHGLPTGSSYSASTSDDVSLGLRANVTSMTALTLDLTHNRYESENAENTRRTGDTAMFGMKQRIDALYSVDFGVGRERIKTTRDTTGEETESGAVYSLGLQRDDPFGYYRIGYERHLTENGKRDDLTLEREMETRTGTFSGTIGISEGDSGSGDWIGTLSYATELPRDRLVASFSRAVQTNDDGDDVVVTRLAGTISHTLSEVNGLDFGVTASSLEYPDKDTLRVDASVAYRHDLTRDTSLQAGVRLGLSQDSNKEDANSQAIFLNLTRKFERQH